MENATHFLTINLG
jgi:diadenosine tetraphosphate (Ap4A) HIT family hydrolase